MSDDQIATWMDLHAGAVADRVNQYNAKQKEGNKVTIEEIDVYNEVFGTDPNFNGEVMSRKLGLEKALEIAFRSARKYFPTSVLMLADNIHYGADTNIAINEESTRTDRVVSSLKARGVPIDGVSEHGHLFIKHFGSQTDVDRYINQLEERAIKLNQAGLVFEIGEADIDIFGASPEQIERAMSLMTTQMKISLKYSKRFILWGTIPKYSWMLDPAYPYGKATPLALHTNDFFPTPLHYEFLKALVPKPQ
jgi:GH35 family endo-1,4-beta-xylanase